jgi:hypothetical protein
VIAAIVVGLLAVGYVALRDADRSDAKFTVVSGPPAPVIPIVIPKGTERYDVVATAVRGAGHLSLEVATYLQPPRDTVVLSLLDARGTRIARCVFPPRSYHDNGDLSCGLPDISRARSLIVTRRGPAKVAIYGHDKQAGTLVVAESTSLAGRVSTVLSRIAVPLPDGVGSSILLIGLFGSVALTAFALLLAVPFAGSSDDRGDLEDDGERATASRVPMQDERPESHGGGDPD